METVMRSLDGQEIRPLPIVAGHLALDFANTVDDPLGPQRWDHLGDYPALLAWCDRTELLPGGATTELAARADRQPRRAAAVVQQSAALRTALNETFGAVLEGTDPNRGWTLLRPYVLAAIQHATVPTSPPPAKPQWTYAELESPLWPVAAAAYDLLGSPELGRLKRCAGCPWLFLDYSKNHSRRWCSMQDCGTHEKIRRYVDKRAARRS